MRTVSLAAVVDGEGAHSSQLHTATVDGSSILLDGLVYSPDVGAVVVEGSVRTASSVIEGLAAAPDAAGLVGVAASIVFDALVSVVAGALDGALAGTGGDTLARSGLDFHSRVRYQSDELERQP